MKHFKMRIWVAVFCCCCCCFPVYSQESSEAVSFEEVEFDNGMITYKGDLYNGVLESYYPNGRPRAIAQVVGGRYAGVGKVFYPEGQLNMQVRFNQKGMCCVIVAYFANGEQKLKAEVGSQMREGGNRIMDVVYGFYRRGEYQSRFKGKARLQLITHEGLSAFNNAYLPLHKVAGYRIFVNSLKNYGMFIEDSRDIVAPAAD